MNHLRNNSFNKIVYHIILKRKVFRSLEVKKNKRKRTSETAHKKINFRKVKGKEKIKSKGHKKIQISQHHRIVSSQKVIIKIM